MLTAPEEQLLIRLPDGLLVAKPFIDAVRHVGNRLGIDILSPSDKFLIQICKHQWHGIHSGGILTTLPDDVREIVLEIQRIINQHESNREGDSGGARCGPDEHGEI